MRGFSVGLLIFGGRGNAAAVGLTMVLGGCVSGDLALSSPREGNIVLGVIADPDAGPFSCGGSGGASRPEVRRIVGTGR